MNIRNTIDWRVPAANAWNKPEHDLQVAVVTRSLALAEKHPSILLIHAIPNGGWRGAKTGASLKAEGVIPGIPDLFLPVARCGFHGLYLELKKRGGKVKDDQWEVMEALHAEGYFVRITNHLQTALSILENYLEERP